MQKEKVILGFSGGMDSSAAVIILCDAGYDVEAVTLDMTGNNKLINKAKGKATTIGVEWLCVDAKDRFKHHVVDYFTESYLSGRTPAPCTMCNTMIKWPVLEEVADQKDASYIASGHYFKITEYNNRRYVTRAADGSKDQSYYLWGLTQKQLYRILTPMGDMMKSEVKAAAADKSESMGICFLDGHGCREFLKGRCGDMITAGDVVDPDGNILCRHDGIAFYTTGQKKGLYLPPGLCVVGIDHNRQRIVVGSDGMLWYHNLELFGCNIVDREEVLDSDDIRVVIRGIGRNPDGVANVTETCDGLKIELECPAWAPAAGQPVVLYRENRVIGGGWIERYY